MTTKENNVHEDVVIPTNEKDTSIVATKNSVVKQTADIDGFLAKRKEFIEKVNAICIEGKDYHIIQGNKSLAKGGAEKIASIFQWNATFSKDTESIEMLGAIEGLVAFKCILQKGNKFVGEGRGATTLKKNAGDPNKTLKMAQKSAFIDAVLRSSGLSDFYTQDLEDMPKEQFTKPTFYPKPYGPKLELKNDELYLRLSAMIEEAQTTAGLDLVGKDCQIAFNNHKIDARDYALLKSAGIKKREQLTK